MRHRILVGGGLDFPRIERIRSSIAHAWEDNRQELFAYHMPMIP